MRILMVTPDPSDGGGVARSATRVAASLRSVGHTVTTCAPDGSMFPGEVERTADKIRHARLEHGPWAGLVAAEARRFEPDLLLGFYASSAGVVAVAAAGELGRPSVVSVRGNDLDRDFLDPKRHGLTRWALERATLVTTVSTSAASKVEAWCGRPAMFVTNGVDRHRFQPVSGEAFRERHRLEGTVIGMFGELKPKRGLEVLQPLADAGHTLVLVGRVRDSVSHLIPSNTTIVPWLEPAVLPEAYAACDLVIQPSWADGMPNVVLEAMACERTVVARAVGGMVDVIEHGVTGHFAEEDWVDRCAVALTSPTGAAARERVPGLEQERQGWEDALRTLC